MRRKFKNALAIFLASFTSTFVLFFVNYQKYSSSLYKIQTVDFNILAHTLPTKLSYTLIKDNLNELQRTLNSNYGFFGLVVTDCKKIESDCSGQKIIYSTQSKYRKFKLSDLTNNSYDYLRNPVPLVTEGYYKSHLGRDRDITGITNQGKIIGRVYYVRRKRPDFITSLISWIQKPLSYENLNIQYTSIFLLCVLFFVLIGLIIEWIIERKENQRLKVENQLLKIQTFNNAFEQIIEQEFSSEIANRLQQLDHIIKNIFVRIDSDIQNIVHDIYKAPLLFNVNSTSQVIENLGCNNPEIQNHQALISYLKEADETLKTIDWVVKDLRGTTQISNKPTLIKEEIDYFSQHLPPTIKSWTVNFYYDSSPLWINCNPWHLRSIVKNALYNSSAALKKHRRKLKDKSFKGYINVRCKSNQNMAIIEIEDNGSGIPEDILPNLYESSERLNKGDGEFVGNGSMIVFAYLSLHGGKVEKQNLETGTKISFKFPLISEPKN